MKTGLIVAVATTRTDWKMGSKSLWTQRLKQTENSAAR